MAAPTAAAGAAAAGAAAVALAPEALLQEGPLVWRELRDVVHAERPCSHSGRTRRVQLPVVATVPMAAGAAGAGAGAGSATLAAGAAGALAAAPPPPYPVCLLLNGFQARASYYSGIARRLASHGVVVVQYNAPPLTIVPDAVELPWLGEVVGWLRRAAGQGSGGGDGGGDGGGAAGGGGGCGGVPDAAGPLAALQGRADLGRLVVAGHSRGGKLAALHYAAGSVAGVPVRAAFLLDPVNNTRMTPESRDYPSAAKALRAAGRGRPFGMAAAGLISASNPAGSNWEVFQQAAAPGSWRLLLKRAGHTSFMSPPTAVERFLLDRVFGGGPAPRAEVAAQSAAAMLAWFDAALRGGPGGGTGGGGTGGGLAGVPLVAAAGLAAAQRAAGASAAAAAASGGEGGEGGEGGDSGGGGGGAAGVGSGRFAAAFQEWVAAPLVAGEVDLAVVGGANE